MLLLQSHFMYPVVYNRCKTIFCKTIFLFHVFIGFHKDSCIYQVNLTKDRNILYSRQISVDFVNLCISSIVETKKKGNKEIFEE